jgi:hypothetical protein
MTPRKYEIERYIQDWYWDEKSYELAWESGVFLFTFMDYLKETGISDRTLSKHESNTWVIGNFTCQYGCHEKFSPDIFEYPPFHKIEFRRKVSDSSYALQSYESTCNKLAKYVREKAWKTHTEYDFEIPDDIADFCIGLQLLDRKSWRGEKKPLIDFSPQVKAIRQNFVAGLRDVDSKDEFMERMGRCCEVLEEVDQTLDAMNFGDDKFRKRISGDIRKDARWLRSQIEMTMMNF